MGREYNMPIHCSILRSALIGVAGLTLAAVPVRAQEHGVWPLDALPENLIGVSVDPAWIENVPLGVLFLPGCVAALVSQDGLAVTTASCLRSQESWIRPDDAQFAAAALEEERMLAGLVARQIVEVHSDTTDRVREDELEYRMHPRAGGSGYVEFVLKVHEDVRLVMIPSRVVAEFGDETGVYPRHAPDFAFVRLYDAGGLPIDTESYYAWSLRPPEPGEALFMPGRDGPNFALATGTAGTYPYNGTLAPPFTTFFGLLETHHAQGGRGVWALPDHWRAGLSPTLLQAPLNYSAAGRCLGSGAPMVDRDLEVRGIALDRVHAVSGERCVAVASAGIWHSLDTLFNAGRLADELEHQSLPE